MLRGLLKFLIGIAATTLILFTALVAIGILFATPPSDQRMIALLRKNMAAFETLVEMCYEDQRLAEGDWFTTNPYGSTPLQPERLERYKEQFSKTAIVKGVDCRNEQVTLQAFSWGLSISGRQKFYVYDPQNFDDFKVVPSLDDDLEFDETTGSTRALRHIEGLWYLAYYGT